MIKVLDAGFYSTIQDLGRFGYREYGVPISGVMDGYSSGFANMVLGNPENAPVIEMTMIGPKLKFMEAAHIAIAGAKLNIFINGLRVNLHGPVSIKANDILSFGRINKGFRAYLAIAGGFKSEKVLGSQSMYQGITEQVRLQKNDVLFFSSNTFQTKNKNASVRFDNSVLDSSMLEVFEGPEYKFLTQVQQKQLTHSEFTVSKNNNRMAYQLQELLENNIQSILTAPVLPGTVQLTASGQLIILMRDCQTTGGYPRILQLTENAIAMLSQKTTGNAVKFSLKG